MSPNAVLRWVRRRWYVVVGVVAVLALLGWLAKGVLDSAHDRQQRAADAADSRARIERLANRVADQQETLLRVATAIDNATSPAAQARGAANLARAIDDLRRSIDCAELDDEGTYPACADVAGRLNAIRDGLDPFARPAPPAPTQPPAPAPGGPA